MNLASTLERTLQEINLARDETSAEDVQLEELHRRVSALIPFKLPRRDVPFPSHLHLELRSECFPIEAEEDTETPDADAEFINEPVLDEDRIQKEIQEMKACPTSVGKTWTREPGGIYRCSGGGHTLTLDSIAAASQRSNEEFEGSSSEEGKDPTESELWEILRRLSNCPDDGVWIRKRWGYICARGGHVIKHDNPELRRAMVLSDAEDTAPPPVPAEIPDPVTAPVVTVNVPPSPTRLGDAEARIQLSIQSLSTICQDSDRPWSKVSGGYRCEGGAHYISDAHLGIIH